HAHPDDEAIVSGGTMAKAAAEGHRVVLVVATRGERGELPAGGLATGEDLGALRARETHEAARILGVARCEFLGYVDSGMAGTATNGDPDCFWQAGVDEAAGRLAAILGEEAADVLTVYDEVGGYGHPDHIQVHRVGVRAGELAGTPRVYEATYEREYVTELMRAAAESGRLDDVPGDFDPAQFGSPAAAITTRVAVHDFLPAKRLAMAAHASQIPETSFFLAMDDDQFAATWGTEWYIRRGAPAGTSETSVFDGVG
ncbi:MAG: PIG-L family deacetylase, partial [Acidimicrobiales bacterium]